jgi:riboflavin kinase/FMN adenylyltransferase
MPDGLVLTVGKFESIHLGHQKLISEVTARARTLRVPSAAITFSPHPNVLFGQPDYQSLVTPDEREFILAGHGVDYLLVFPFDAAFASQTPERFAALLFDDLHVRALFVGEGFRFGQNHSGTLTELRVEAAKRNAQVVAVPTQDAGEGGKISTSDIRRLVAQRELEKAARVMGFPFFIMGTVAHGKQIGSKMGYPTVNILPPADKLLPADGVYATRTFFGGEAFASVTNVGLRPTVNANQRERTVESFLIGYGGNLYGASIRTEFHHFMRPERKFESIEELREQIAKDVAYVTECIYGQSI